MPRIPPLQVVPAVGVPRLESRRRLLLALTRIWPWAFLGLLLIFFSATGVGFFTLRNSQNILVAITPVLLMGLGQTLVIISAGIDLSVGWVMGLSSVASAIVIRDVTAAGAMGPFPAILLGALAGLAVAVFIGFANGAIVAKLHVPAFIVTLGTSFVARGAAYLLCGGNVVGGQPPAVRAFGNDALMYLVRGAGGGLYFFKKPDVTGLQLRMMDRILPWPVIVTVVAVAIFIFVLRKMQFGRHVYAIGGNREAAIRAGIPVDRHTILLYTLSAATAGLAGVLNTARFSGGSAIAGDPLLLPSIAAVIIGGVSLFGGKGTVLGTVVGALIIAVLQTGLVMLAVQPFWQFVVVGIVVILAVLMDQMRDLVLGRAESA
ncbi:MAG TPA: ABC transporter permease [Trueperaceae bacterium]|nr:ABC transporter permease [Trueperaceae bacterium]